MRFSIDTNILFYSVDRDSGKKHDLAVEIIANARFGDCLLTVQALAEFFHAATRKGVVSYKQAKQLVGLWQTYFEVIGNDADALTWAMEMREKGELSFWDAMLLRTAANAGCQVIFSEDMADDMVYGAIQIINPFEGDHLSKRAVRVLSV